MLIPRSVFSLARCCDTESGRYALGGIRFERAAADQDPIAIACDGHICVATTWQEDRDYPLEHIPGMDLSPVADFETILAAADCAAAAKLARPTVGLLNRKPVLRQVVLDEVAAAKNKAAEAAKEGATPDNAQVKLPLAATNIDSTATHAPTAINGRFPKSARRFPHLHVRQFGEPGSQRHKPACRLAICGRSRRWFWWPENDCRDGSQYPERGRPQAAGSFHRQRRRPQDGGRGHADVRPESGRRTGDQAVVAGRARLERSQ